MVGPAVVRRLALSLPATVEADHHGFPSFRVAGKIFATMPDAQRLNVMLDARGVEQAVELAPKVCEPVHWGRKLAGVRVALPAADSALVERLLKLAWDGKAPRRLAKPSRP